MESIKSLTGLRALAAFSVIGFHIQTDEHYHFIQMGALSAFNAKGYLGVDLFFILSGFIISYVYFDSMKQFNVSKTIDFLVLRLARIIPVHYFMLFIFVMVFLTNCLLNLNPAKPERFTALNFIYHLLNIQGWGIASSNSWNEVAWSVSAEWLAYLCFPLIALTWLRIEKPFVHISLIAVLVSVMSLISVWNGTGHFAWSFDYGWIRVLCEFLMGCSAFKLFDYQQRQNKLFRRNRNSFASPDLVASLLLVLAGIFIFSRVHDGFIVATLPFFLIALAQSRSWIDAVFSNPLLVYLGTFSYSIYMVHDFIKLSLRVPLKTLFTIAEGANLGALAQLTLMPLFLCVTILFAAFIYHYIENPARILIKNQLKNFSQQKIRSTTQPLPKA